MASKKKSKKNPAVDPKSKGDSQNKGLLSGRLNGIAVALLTALVAEIVQQVLDRLFSSHDQSRAADDRSDAAESDNRAEGVSQSMSDAEDNPITATAGLVADRVNQTKPLMKDVLKTIRSTVEEAAPRLNEAISVLQAASNDPQQAVATLVRNAVTGTRENLETAATAATPDLDSWISNAISAAQSAVDHVPGVDLDKNKEQGKKKKGKKKKGKKAKK